MGGVKLNFNKKVVIIVCSVILVAILVWGFVSFFSNNHNVLNVKPKTQEELLKSKIQVVDIKKTMDGKLTRVTGWAKNNDKAEHTFNININFLDKNKKVLGTVPASVEKLLPGGKKDFSASITADYSKAASMSTEVVNIK
jgi:hypothetical protein